MDDVTFAKAMIQELERETGSTRKCLERIPPELFGWKPHEKSMNTGYLTLLVAEIPSWIKYIIDPGEIDFATFKHLQPKTTAEVVNHFDENVEIAKKALSAVEDGGLAGDFYLKSNGQIMYASSKKENIETSINHMVHHRGQLTVYMRLNNILVPSIYGPSADDKDFKGAVQH